MQEDEQELISRGLDADLNRREMRKLYKLIAVDDDAREEAGELADLEERLADMAELAPKFAQEHQFAPDFTSRLQANILKDQRDATQSAPGFVNRLWQWIRSPHGLSVQPLSFASGLAVAVLGVMMLTPVVKERVIAEPARFIVNDMKFTKAQTTTDWTYQFIVMPGGATRVALDQGDDLPMHFQFESAEKTPLVVNHETGGRKKAPPQRFVVDGIGFASLLEPRAGDSIVVHNNGKVPVVVYAYTNGYGGSWVFPGEEKSL